MFFTKVHGLGNDFIVVDAASEKLPRDLAKFAGEICDRHFGVGADGFVLLWPSDAADIRMQIINSDGSEAEMCGNAIRCVSKYIYEQGIIKKEKIKVETKAGIMVPEVKIENGAVSTVRVNMGRPKLKRTDIPMNKPLPEPASGPVKEPVTKPVEGAEGKVIAENLKVGEHSFKITAVSMGNPHAVIFVADVDSIPLSHWGSRIENHSIFPRKTNVEFVQVLSATEIKMRVWERGAGLTMACGTGACAATVAACLNEVTEKTVKVHLTGGMLEIEWSDDDHVYMTGPAEIVFTGNFPVQDWD